MTFTRIKILQCLFKKSQASLSRRHSPERTGLCPIQSPDLEAGSCPVVAGGPNHVTSNEHRDIHRVAVEWGVTELSQPDQSDHSSLAPFVCFSQRNSQTPLLRLPTRCGKRLRCVRAVVVSELLVWICTSDLSTSCETDHQQRRHFRGPLKMRIGRACSVHTCVKILQKRGKEGGKEKRSNIERR